MQEAQETQEQVAARQKARFVVTFCPKNDANIWQWMGVVDGGLCPDCVEVAKASDYRATLCELHFSYHKRGMKGWFRIRRARLAEAKKRLGSWPPAAFRRLT